MSSAENDDSENEAIISVRRTKKIQIADSDSDENVTNQQTTNVGLDTNKSSDNDDTDVDQDVIGVKIRKAFIPQRITRPASSEDSDDENDANKQNEITESMSVVDEVCEKNVKSADEDDSQEISKPVYKPYSNSDLYDADESEEEPTSFGNEHSYNENSGAAMYNSDEEEGNPLKSNRKSSQSKHKKKEKKKKEKVKSSSDNMREIRRTSQRMLRESRCILPYHRPKQRTLAEFIQRRKSAPSIPLKTNQEHLMRIGKQIEELENQSKDFFGASDDEKNYDFLDDSNDDKKDDSDDDYIPDYLKSKNKLNPETDNNLSDNLVKKLKVNNSVRIVNKNKHDRKLESGDLNINFDDNRISSGNVKELRISEEKDVNSLSNQVEDCESGTIELLNKIKQKLFTDLDVMNNTEPSQSESHVFGNDCTVGDDNVNIMKDSEELNFELKISEDSNPEIENDEISCVKSVTVSESSVKITFSHSETNEETSDYTKHTEITSSKTNEFSLLNKISSHSNFQNSEDFSLRIEESENILVYSEEVYKDKLCKANIINDFDSHHDERILTNELNYEKIEMSDEDNSENVTSDGKSTLDSTDNKIKINENDLLKNKYQGVDIDLKKIPQLIGHSNEKINLYSPPKSTAITDLKKRFFQHFSMDKKIKVQEKVEISVVTPEMSSEGTVDNIKQETINTIVNKNEEKWLEDIKEAQQPGAKLALLKSHLEKQLKERWKEDWSKRIQEYKLNEEEKIDEDAKSGYEDDAVLLDDEDVETDLTETESEEELEEDDVSLVDRIRPQSKFLDDEADETDGEEQEDVDDVGADDEIEETEDILLGNNGSDMDDDDNGNKSDDNEFASEDNNEDDNDDEEEEENKIVMTHAEKQKKSRNKDESSDSEDNLSIDATEDCTSKLMDVDEISSQATDKSRGFFQNSQEEHESGGRFACIEDLVNNTQGIDKLSQSDIMRICSGTFPSQSIALSQLEDSDEKSKYSLFLNSQSQNLNLTLPDCSQNNQTNTDDEDLNTDLRTQTSILNSDDEDGEIFERSQKNKKQKIIKYSDDEDESDDAESKKIDYDDRNDDYDEEEELNEDEGVDITGNENDEDAEVEYDSEENEIIKDGKIFLEKEAELSESEWGSEDEDEKDLDKFEAEAGDEDELDQDKLKGELGKIHMQRMLVDDKNEVRLLKELLLEDGELHSDESGRVRRFRWANADGDDVGGQSALLKDSDDEDSDNGDEEENWRRKRHERELYIQKQREKLKELGIEDAIDDKKDNNENDLLDVGRAMLKKIQKTQTAPSKPLGLQKSINVKVGIGPGPGRLSNSAGVKRGSFLKSSSNFLSRLAHITSKVGSEGNVNGPKNSRNFVFSVVSPPKKGQGEDEAENRMVKKRKADEKIESSKKKIHFSNGVKSSGPHKSLLDMLTATN